MRDTVTPRFERLRQEALNHVNEVRSQYGLPPLERLVPGRPGSSRCCPIARSVEHGSLNIECSAIPGFTYVWPAGTSRTLTQVKHKGNQNTYEFVRNFDACHYPDLIRDE